MNKKSAFLAAAVMAFAFTGCDKTVTPGKDYYSSVSEVTLEKIMEQSKPVNMIAYKGGYKQTIKYTGYADKNIDDSEVYLCYKKNGKITEINQIAKYPDDYFTYVYMSDDRSDARVYTQTPMGIMADDFTDEYLKQMTEETVLGYNNFQAEIMDVSEDNGLYVVNIEISRDGKKAGDDTVTIDPVTGMPLKVESSDNSSGQEIHVVSEFTYTDDIEIIRSPKEQYKEESDHILDEQNDSAAEGDNQ